MAKKKDWFTKLKEQGKITDPEFDKFIEALGDEEFPDAAIAHIENKFMTYDRAIADPGVNGKIRSEVFDTVDAKVNELIEVHIKDYLEPLQIQELKKEGTYKKLDILKRIVPDAFKKVKSGTATDEELKRQLKDKDKAISELGTEKITLAQQFEQYKESAKDEREKEIEKLNTEFFLEKLGSKYTLAEAFENDRDAVNQIVKKKLESHNLKLQDSNGQKSIAVLDEAGKPKFNGNSAVTINSLLDDYYKPFVKKSETPPNNRSQGSSGQTTVPSSPTNPARRTGVSTTVVNKV